MAMKQKHQKNFSRIVLALLSVAFMAPTALAVTFKDLAPSNRNYDAIQYLANRGTIKGYADGTFQPNHAVTRAEFLKLAEESSNIFPDGKDTTIIAFTDVKKTDWYYKYLQIARKENWIQGYADNTFRADQPVTKAEGLKMMGAIQKWKTTKPTVMPFKDTPLDLWSTPFISYAKSKNFLEETGDTFLPNANLTRGKTSEMLFRTLITSETKSTVFSKDLLAKVTSGGSSLPQPVIPADPIQDFTAVMPDIISKSFFDNATLDEDFPNTFYMNEVYYFDGTIQSGTFDTAFVFLKNGVDESFENTIKKVANNRFSIPVIFQKPGNYKLGLIMGTSGKSKVVNVSVLPSLPQPTSPGTVNKPTNATISYKNQITSITWKNDSNLSKVIIYQNNSTKSYFFRQPKNNFSLNYQDFGDFKEGRTYFQVQAAKGSGTASLSIDSAWATTDPIAFDAIQHHFADTNPANITYNLLPETFNTPGVITMNGKALTDIFKDAAVIRPDGVIETVELTSTKTSPMYYGAEIIASGNDYTFTYTTKQTGTYFIELNDKNGLAVINIPVYVQTGIPFVPDFFDLYLTTTTEPKLTVEAARKKLLEYINKERTDANIKAVTIDINLNTLAQNHADDMVKRDYFAHINPDKQTPDDRRQALKIPTEVGENLARAPSLAYTHYGLMRSAIHRKNILNPKWTRVGLGITTTADNDTIVVEEFSSNPLTAQDLQNLKQEVGTKITLERINKSLTPFNADGTLTNLADQWSTLMAQQKFFSFSAPDGTILSTLIQQSVTNKSVQAFILESNNIDKLSTEISHNSAMLDAQWSTIGMGLQVDDIGTYKLTVLLSK